MSRPLLPGSLEVPERDLSLEVDQALAILREVAVPVGPRPLLVPAARVVVDRIRELTATIDALRAEVERLTAERDEWRRNAEVVEVAANAWHDDAERLDVQNNIHREGLETSVRQRDEQIARAERAEAAAGAMRLAGLGMVKLLGSVIHGEDPVALDPDRKVAAAFNAAFGDDHTPGRALLERVDRYERALTAIWRNGHEASDRARAALDGRDA